MTIEQRMERKAQEQSDMHPLLWNKLHRPRTVFTPGHRISMNVIPMFMNVFLPWGMFIFTASVMSFSIRYNHPAAADGLVVVAFLAWIATIGAAIWARRNTNEPTWYTFFAIMVGIAVVSGVTFGGINYDSYMLKYFNIQDLKVVQQVDASLEHGQNVMDAGIVYFAQNNRIDNEKAWHFKHDTMYCVVPIIGSLSTPATQSYDLWAVGKDCCSMHSSDFRCGDATLPAARSAIRVMGDEELVYYGLAVEQAASLYNINANHPIFFTWEEDPRGVVNGWNNEGFACFVKGMAFFFVFCLFCVAVASCGFSFIGRGESVYDMDFYNDEGWRAGGYMEGNMNMQSRMFAA